MRRANIAHFFHINLLTVLRHNPALSHGAMTLMSHGAMTLMEGMCCSSSWAAEPALDIRVGMQEGDGTLEFLVLLGCTEQYTLMLERLVNTEHQCGVSRAPRAVHVGRWWAVLCLPTNPHVCRVSRYCFAHSLSLHPGDSLPAGLLPKQTKPL